MHLSANCSLKSVCTFKKKSAKESFELWLAYSAIKFVVKMILKMQKKTCNKKRRSFPVHCLSITFIHKSKKNFVL